MHCEDGELWRRRRRMRHLTILGKIGGGKMGGGEMGGGEMGGGEMGGKESIWTQGRLSMYFLCGNANKIYLDALCDVMPASSFADSRMSLWPEFPVEYICPESSRSLLE